MNHIYKVIWSRVKHCYVVVSEIATNGGKSRTVFEKKNASFGALLCAFALAGCLMPSVVEASFNAGIGSSVFHKNSIAVGDTATTTKEYTVALGSRTQATDIYAIAIGDQAKATGQGATAIGSLSLSTALHSLAVGDQAHATGQDSSAYGLKSQATGLASVAVGADAKAKSQNAIAMGNTSTVTGLNAIGIGSLANAEGTQTVVVGRQAHSDANSENSVAIGQGAHAGGQKRANDSYSASTIAIGNVAHAMENGDITIGRQATSSVSKYHNQEGSGAVVMGAEAHSYGSRGDVAIGSGAEASIIRKGVTNPDDNPEYSQGTAIGSMAKVYGTQSIGIGGDVRAIGHSSIAIGGDDIETAKPDLNTVVPDMAVAGTQKNFNRELAALYPGTTLGSGALNDSKKYVNTASIGHGSMAIGMMTQSLGTGSTAIGVNSLTKGVASTGIGVMARSWGKNSLAVGSQVGAYGDKAISIGDTNTVGFDMTDGATSGTKSAALGVENKVYGSNSYAIGDGNTIGSATITETTEANGDKIKKVTAGTVKGNTAGAFGNKNTITTDNAYAVGNNSTASADGAMIVGSSASVTGKNGVALGNNTKVANENAVAIGNGSETAAAVATQSATINGVAHNFAGVNPTSTVSVGKAGVERTITNVAAGRISATSTDAINGSQLYAVTTEVDKGVVYAGDVKAAAAPDNKFTQKLGSQTNIVGGVTDESKLSDNNIGVVSNGTDTLNVKLAKDLNVESVTTGTTVINNNGLTIGGKSFITPNGINANNAPITNVADGNVAPNSKDAVNGGQLNEVKELAGKHTIVKVDGEENKTDGNLLIAKTDNNGQATYDLKLNDNLAIGKEGPTGKDGSIGVKGKDGSAVAINGKDGSINLNGANGANGLTMKSGDAKPAVDGTGITRLVLEENGVKHDVATLDDGLQFTGNNENTVNKHKLNTLVKVEGEGVTQADSDNFASASGNINVKANGTDKLELQLAKDLKNLDSVTAAKTVKAGDAVMGGQTVTNAGGDNETGNYVTGLDNKTWNPDKIVSGRAATEDQVKDAIAAQTATGLKFDANVGGVKTNKLGSTVLVKGEGTAADNDYSGENIKTFITQDNDGNTTINVKMNRSLLADSIKVNKKGKDAKDGVTLTGPDGANGTDGKVGISGKDGKDAVSMSGKDGVGHIGLAGPAGTNGVNGSNGIDMSVKNGYDDPAKGVKGEKGVDGVNAITRIVYQDANGEHQVATLDDGLQFTGNNENTVNKHKLNTLVKVQGEGVTQADSDNFASASGNINVKANGTDKLELQLAKDLKNLDSVTAAKTVKAGDAVMGGQTVTNAGGDNETGNYVTGLDNKTWNPDKIVSGRAATEDQVKDAIAAQTATGLKFDANVGGVKTNKLGSTVLVKGEGTAADNDYSGENIKTFITQDNDGNTTINVKMNRSLLADSIKVNKKGKDAKDGVTLTGPDGANGTDGKVGISGKDGKDAVSMSGKDGVGHIGLNGKDGRNADMIVDKGTPDLDGNEITRIKYTDENGTPHEVATKDDGMMYGGDSGTVIKKKLNSQVNVKGGITDENLLTDEDNIGVVSDGNNTLKLRLAKDLQGLKSATFKNGNVNTVINGDGMTITETTPAGNNSVSLTKDGLNNGGKKITNVAEGTDPNDAVNVNQLKKATDAATTTVTAGNNITVTPTTNPNGSTNYEVGLKDQVTLGSDPTKQIALDGTTGTIKAGDKVTIDGNKGNITAGKVAIDGENGIIKAGDKVTIDGKDGKIDAGKIAVDGKDGYVTGLENKTFDPANIVSGRAATEDQLKASHDSLNQKITNMGDEITKKGMDFAGNTGEFHRDLGQKVTIKGEGTEADDKYSGENIKTVADKDGNITIKMAKDIKADSVTANTVNGGTVNADKVKVGKSGPDGVTITGPNGADGTDGKVGVSGKDGKDAVSMSGKDGVGHIGLTGKDGRNADITAEKGDEDLDGNEITRMKYMDENGTPHQVATKDDGMKYGGDSGNVIKKKLNEQVNIVGGISDVSKLSSEDNLGVVSDGTGNLKIRMAKDLKGLESVTTKDAAGNTTVMNGGGMTITPATGDSVSLTKDGLNNGGNRITNVGPGVNGTDAVNMNQLNGLMSDMEGQIADSGAASAAISGLKPLQYDPLEPTQVMAALGHYKGSTAAALGVAHYTNESTLFHMGVSLGGHDNMFNAGVSYKFGTSDAKKAVPERYKGGPISSAYVMQDEVTALKAKYEKVQRDNEEMKAQIAFLMEQLGNK